MCLQTLLSKYNQQYHKLFKDIPLEEMVLKGELSPWCGCQVPAMPGAQALYSGGSKAQFRYGNSLPFGRGWCFFLQKCEKTGLVWDMQLNL